MSALTLQVTPSGRLVAALVAGGTRGGTGSHSAISAAFADGPGAGLLHLGAVEVDTALSPALAYFRDFARAFVARLCQSAPATEGLGPDPVPVDEAAIDRAAATAPPIAGAEYLNAEALRGLWGSMEAALRLELANAGQSLEAYLRAASPVWNLVGRVHFHLAENRRDPDRPFAFLATYTTGVAASGKVQHAPLGQALRVYAGTRNSAALLSLLSPVQRASARISWVKELVDAGTIYQPVRWSPDQALRFLHDLEALESAGLTVRVPDLWRDRRPPRATVQVKVGGDPPGGFGAEGLLDFDVGLTLEGERLTADEAREILAATGGLVFLRGRWVEIDRDRLRAALDDWQKVEKGQGDKGISFFEAMRLVAGAGLDPAGPVGAPDEGNEWVRVTAGPWLEQALAGLRSPDGVKAAELGSDLQASLRPYQKVGVRWLWWLRRLGLGGCLADDMGLGKTIQVISLLLLAKRDGAGPSLLVVPASLIGNWQSEIARFAPSLRVLIAHGSALAGEEIATAVSARLGETDLVITSYGSVARVEPLREANWDTVVLDEAQAIKNAGTQQARACKALRGRLRLALTGTPVENRLGDLWSLFDFCAPGLLGTDRQFSSFVKRLEARPHDAYGPLRALVRPYILRRLKTDKTVISDLPDKTEMKAFCTLHRKQAVLYEQAVKELATSLATKEGIERRGLVLSSLMRLKQICNHPSHWLGDGLFDPRESGKYQRLAALAAEIAERQEKLLVFTQFREMTEPLAAHLGRVFGRAGLVLSGDTDVKQRKRLVDEFQSEEGPPFFVLSLRAGGTGLNLTAASHVIHFDRWWNPAVEQQATDRAFRIGQTRNVVVHKLICQGTLEEKIDALIESKRALSTQVVGEGDSGEAALTEMSNEELLALVSLDSTSVLEDEPEEAS